MHRVVNILIRGFISSTLGIYLILFLFTSYVIVEVNNHGGDPFSQVRMFAFLCVLCLPILLFAFYREVITRKYPSGVYIPLWAFCFLLIPFLVYIKRNYICEFTRSIETPSDWISSHCLSDVIIPIVLFILLTEIGILVDIFVQKRHKISNWVGHIKLDHLIIASLFILVFMLGIRGVSRQEGSLSVLNSVFYFFKFSLQYLVIISSIYFYYHINAHILIPKIFKQNGLVYYGFSVAGVILLFYPIFVFLIRLLPIVEEFKIGSYFGNDNIYASDGGGVPFLVILLSIPIVISNQWFQQNNKITTLEKEQSETELNLLKQQINPHFFFNTLNNLYALSITKDKQTPEVILQLSELMRYVIYKGKEKYVPLKDEVKYIEDYINLQLIRLHKNIDFKFEKSIENGDLEVPPLLFIAFVENAFKHGIEPSEKDCFLHLTLRADHQKIHFECVNSLELKNVNKPGIGLKNLRRRLKLRYPEKHELNLKEQEHRFEASLRITIL